MGAFAFRQQQERCCLYSEGRSLPLAGDSLNVACHVFLSPFPLGCHLSSNIDCAIQGFVCWSVRCSTHLYLMSSQGETRKTIALLSTFKVTAS